MNLNNHAFSLGGCGSRSTWYLNMAGTDLRQVALNLQPSFFFNNQSSVLNPESSDTTSQSSVGSESSIVLRHHFSVLKCQSSVVCPQFVLRLESQSSPLLLESQYGVDGVHHSVSGGDVWHQHQRAVHLHRH